MGAGIARKGALAVVGAVVFSLLVPHAAHPAAPPTASPQASAKTSPHDADWSPPHIDLSGTRHAISQASPSPSTSRNFETTSPPNPCYYSVWFDPANDAPELDATSYGALYDCPSGTWTFPVNTRDNWASSELDTYAILLETDGNFTDGCQGIDYALVGTFDQGSLQAGLLRVTDCNTNDWALVTSAAIARSGLDQIALGIPNSALGSPSNLRWVGFISGLSEQGEDDIPDMVNGVQPAHQEDGYTFSSSGCSVGVDFGQLKSYSVVDNPAAAAAVLQAAGQPGVTATGSHPGVVRFSGDPAAAGATLARAGIQADVSPDLVRHFQATVNDQDFGQQWYLQHVNAPSAWDTTTGSAAVIAADLDSGVDPTHPDLQGKLVPGEDFTGPSPVPLSTTTNSDDVGHGTATAGLIGAATNNTTDVASLGYSTSVMPLKVGDASGVLSSDSALGMRWAADHGAKVANASYGSPCADANEHAAVNYAQAHGVLVVASGGNEAAEGDRPDYPAAYPGVLAVGATDNTDAPASYSNFGNYIDMAAPGGNGSSSPTPTTDMLVLAPGAHEAAGAGTSFSAPLVSAAGALLFAVNPNLTGASARSLLMDTATDIFSPGRDARSGTGLLNAALAVQTAALQTKFNPLPPARILDTRNGTGGGPVAPLGPNQTRLVKVTGVGNVPASGVSAVVLNVTAVGPSAGSFLTVYPSGVSRPLASNLNFPPGVNIPNLVVTKVGGDGNVALYNAQGNVDVVFDVVGWYGQTGDSYNALTPARILDTRNGSGRLGAGESRAVKIAGADGVPGSGATAVVLNVTAVAPSAGSYLTVYPSDVAKPLASNLNFAPGQNIPNLVVVKVGSDGNVDVYNDQGTVDVIFDVVGWFGSTGSSYGPIPPQRVLDTRDGTGGAAARLGPGEARAVKVAGVGGTPGTGISAVVLNVTAVSPSAGSYLTVYPSGVSRPVASNLNFGPGQIIPNLVFVKVGQDGNVILYNDQGTVDVVFDVVGWFT